MEAEQEQVPDIGFSVAELQYLLSIAPGPQADKSAEWLNVGPVPSVDDTIMNGGAALLTRGQLEFLPGGEFKPVDAALVVAFILTNAVRWTRISGATDDAADLGVFIESPHGGVLAQPRTLGTWWFIILDPAAVPSEIVVSSAMGLAHEGERTGVVVQTATLTADRTFSIRRDGAGYGYAYGDTGNESPDLHSESAAIEKLLADLTTFVTDFPTEG